VPDENFLRQPVNHSRMTGFDKPYNFQGDFISKCCFEKDRLGREIPGPDYLPHDD
jgi:hypothetical protein